MRWFTDEPRAVALRIFGAVGILVAAMTATLLPASIYAAMDGPMRSMH